MPEPRWVDSSVMIELGRGDRAVRTYLKGLQKRGIHLLLPPEVDHEILFGTRETVDSTGKVVPARAVSAQQRAAMTALKTEMHITVDSVAAKSYRYPAYRHPNLGEGDSMVMVEVQMGAQVRRVEKPILISLDTKSFQGMKLRGIQPESPPIELKKPTPANPVPGLAVPPPNLKANFSSLKLAVGIALVGGALDMLNMWGMEHYAEKSNERIMKEEMRKLGDEIDKYVNARKRVVFDEWVDDGTAYVIAEIEITYLSTWIKPDIPGEGGYWGPAQLASGSVLIDSVGISSKKGDSKASTIPKTNDHIILGYKEDTYTSSISAPIPVSAKDFYHYKDLRRSLEAIRSMLNLPGLPHVTRQQILQSADFMEDEISKQFPLDEFKPDPRLWTKDGLARITGKE